MKYLIFLLLLTTGVAVADKLDILEKDKKLEIMCILPSTGAFVLEDNGDLKFVVKGCDGKPKVWTAQKDGYI